MVSNPLKNDSSFCFLFVLIFFFFVPLFKLLVSLRGSFSHNITPCCGYSFVVTIHSD